MDSPVVDRGQAPQEVGLEEQAGAAPEAARGERVDEEFRRVDAPRVAVEEQAGAAPEAAQGEQVHEQHRHMHASRVATSSQETDLEQPGAAQEEAQGEQAAEEGPHSHGPGRRLTLWRLPSTRGKMPRYVQRRFRLKAMALLCVQLFVVLGIVNLMGHLEISREVGSGLAMSGLSFLIIMLMLLASARNNYPANYVLLAVVTLLAGVAWGVSDAFWPKGMQDQILGIVTVAMVVAAGMTAILSDLRWRSQESLLASVLVGAVVGVAADAVVAWQVSGATREQFALSAAVALCLLAAFTLLAGPHLVECNPDMFMTAVIAMDASLFAVVSWPVAWSMTFGFLVPCCFSLASGDEGQAANQLPRAIRA